MKQQEKARCLGAGLIVALTFSVGCGRDSYSSSQADKKMMDGPNQIAEPPGGRDDDEKPPFSLHISLAEKPARDRVVVKITVEATGGRDIVWDSQYSALMEWIVRREDGKLIPQVKAPGEGIVEMARNRFITVKAGAHNSKLVNITERIQRITYGQFFMGLNGVESSRGGEEVVRYVFDKDVQSINVRLEYQSGVPLKVLFGIDEKDIGLSRGSLRSNDLHIDFPSAQ